MQCYSCKRDNAVYQGIYNDTQFCIECIAGMNNYVRKEM